MTFCAELSSAKPAGKTNPWTIMDTSPVARLILAYRVTRGDQRRRAGRFRYYS